MKHSMERQNYFRYVRPKGIIRNVGEVNGGTCAVWRAVGKTVYP